MKALIVVATVLLVSGCAQTERAKKIALSAIDYYCSAGDAERDALRAQVTTDKGPLVQVNCENLPDPI